MQREKNFTKKEKSYLLDLIFMYRNVIESKITDHLSNLHKNEAWASITQEYNKNTEGERTEKNLRYCWDNIKKGTRKYCATWKREMYKTGGGVVNIEKDTLYERAKEIMGETASQGLLNPFDSDCIGENVHNKENVIHILEEDNVNDPAISLVRDNENDPAVFSHLIKSKEITNWKTWNSQKLKSQISAPLKNNIMETVSTQKGLKKRKYDSDKAYQETLDEAKIDLTNTFKTNVEEKHTYEIELLKHQLEKEKLKIELLKLIIEKEKSIKQNEEKSSVHVTL